jgi:hypothetical protein
MLKVARAKHITIGPEFFAKARNDYDNWHWAVIREFFQNGIDCGSSEIHVEITETGGSTILRVRNDGDPMNEAVLVDKLLCLGGSGKNFDNTTGGFGKAKEVLYFCHESYMIRSGNLRVDGSGASYDLTTDEYVDGTISEISISGCHQDELLKQIKVFCGVGQWSGTFYVNGVPMTASLRKGSPRRDLGFGVVYTNRSCTYRMIVRINGIPMFITSTGLDRCVIVELKGQSDEVMTSNRDGLVSPYRDELSSFVTELAVDKRSALKDRRRGPRYKEYRGTKLCHSQALNVVEAVGVVGVEAVLKDEYRSGGPARDEAVIDDGVSSGVDVAGDAEVHDPVVHEAGVRQGRRAAAYAPGESGFEPRRQVATLGTNFVVKNETDLKVPAYYDPGSGEFSAYSHKLVRIWGRIMLEMHRLFDREAEFSIGFIFDDGESEAECEDRSYGLVYYLNPCKVVEQSASCSKSFRKRFKLTERDRLIAIGAHEFVHALGYGWHDESYACKLTDVLAVVMKHRKRFNWCFQ